MLEPVENVIKKGVKDRLFTGASIAVWSGTEKLEFMKGYGTTEAEFKKYHVNRNTFFDLASLTKPLVTALCFMKLVEEERVCLTTKLETFFDLKNSDKAKITIGDLLSHSSGLPAHFKFYEECESNCINFVVEKIFNTDLNNTTNNPFVYSDLGYIILGEIIKKITGKDIKKYWLEKIISPLKLEDNFTFSGDNNLNTENCCLTKNLVDPDIVHCGSVHDDNCRIMGGIAGHAGLFGNLEGVYSLVKNIFKTARNESSDLFIKNSSLSGFFNKKKNSTWVCGFDTPSTLYSSSGKYFSKKSIGHLGFTGTSFWIDLEKQIFIILLTNRAYYPESLKQMKIFRPNFHDVIMKNLS